MSDTQHCTEGTGAKQVPIPLPDGLSLSPLLHQLDLRAGAQVNVGSGDRRADLEDQIRQNAARSVRIRAHADDLEADEAAAPAERVHGWIAVHRAELAHVALVERADLALGGGR